MAARRRTGVYRHAVAFDLKAWADARSPAAAVRLRALDRALRRLRPRPGDPLARGRHPSLLRRPRRCGSRPRPAASTSPRTTRRSRPRCSTSSGCRSISRASTPGRQGDEMLAPARDRARRLPAAAAGRSVRGARHLDHGAAGLAPVGGRDPEPLHRALRRRRASTRTPSRRASGWRARPRTELVGVGFSTRKAEYVVGLARSELDLDELAALPDEEVTARLVALRGLGEWTADWFLARHLARPHAWPAGDLGLRKAVAAFYGDVPDVRSLRRPASTPSRT